MENSINRKSLPTDFIILCIGIFSIAFSPILIKVGFGELGANVITFHRMWIAALALGIWNSVKFKKNQDNKDYLPQLQPYTQKTWLILLVGGLADAFCMSSWVWSINQTSIAHSTVLHNLTAIFTTLGGWLFFRQYFEKRFLLAIAITIAGSTVISLEDWQTSSASLVGDGAALLSSLAYSAKLLAIEQLREELSTTTILFWICLITTIAVFPLALLFHEQIFPSSGLIWLSVILQGLFCEVIGQGAISYSLKRFSSGFISLLLLLEPVFAAILAWFIFGQQLTLFDWVSFPVIFLGIYLANSSQGAEKDEVTGLARLKPH